MRKWANDVINQSEDPTTSRDEWESFISLNYLPELMILINRGYRYRRIFVNFESRVKVLVFFFRKAEVGSRHLEQHGHATAGRSRQ